MRRRTPRESGFTLTEVIAVVSIIAVLLGLTIPAITASRSASRRTRCINNLKQIVLALHNYESVYEHLPAGVIEPTGPVRNRREGLHVGWVVALLPYMEQWGLYGTINPNFSIYAPINAKTTATSLNSFLCPSDRRSNTPGTTSYAACHNDVEAPIDVDNHGVFYLNSRTQREDITDGNSYTIFIGEKPIVGSDLGWASGTRATLRNTGSPLNARPTFADGPADSPLFVGGFGSYHPGGTNFAFGDGSVRFLSERIDASVYRLLGNRADGELISSAAFPNAIGAPTK